jgi:hypothetical protein
VSLADAVPVAKLPNAAAPATPAAVLPTVLRNDLRLGSSSVIISCIRMLSYLLVLQFAWAGIVWLYLELCKIFKNEIHRVQVTFDLCTELGHSRVILLAAFFLIWGYFSTHQVVFRPWGLQNTKNAFYKKMLCDQASDTINSEIITSHVPLTTSILLHYIIGFVNTRVPDQPCPLLATALGSTTLRQPHQ